MKNIFKDTAKAFAYKSDDELRRAYILFSSMKYFPKLTVLLARLGNHAMRWKIPFVRSLIEKFFFEHFCGGETLESCTPTVRKLSAYNVQTALDFGVEGQNSSEQWKKMGENIIETIVFAADKDSIPVVSLKLTAIASFHLLEKYSNDKSSLTSEENNSIKLVKERLEQICAAAERANIILYMDAEESWIQSALDNMAMEMMLQFNKEKPVLFNTYQLYLKSSLARLKTHQKWCEANDVFFGAKLVRGAYMDKENRRAELLGIESPVQPSKKATDLAYNEAARYCLKHYHNTFFSLATHNEASNEKLIQEMEETGIPSDHVHFCQLYGMSDHITFSLAERDYTVLKYLPFGKVEETFPYMIRRAEENTSVTKDATSELSRIRQELKRRKAADQASKADQKKGKFVRA